jgi:solute carrier family 35 protein E3
MLFNNYHFHSPIALTLFHFCVTTGIVNVFRKLGLFKRINASANDKWMTSFLNSIGLLLSNMNLRYNSVGFYQLSKLLVIPCILIIEFFTQKKRYTINVLCSLLFLLIGVGLFSINDMSLNFFGTVVALCTVMAGATVQIRFSVISKKYNTSGLGIQDMMNIPNLCFVSLFFLLLESYGPNSIFNHTFQGKELLIILATGLISIGVNVFAQGLIGKTSPLTFQVVGHCKSILIFTFGLIVFPFVGTHTQLIRQICGLAVAMCGVILYSWFVIKGQAVKKVEEKLIQKDEDEIPLKENIDQAAELKSSDSLKDGAIFENVSSKNEND